VISGFRVARGGMQARTGVTPDLTILGKVIGGGLPSAAYAGRADLMQRIAPAGDVYQAGTLSGNPLAVAAGLATLELLDDDAYAHLAATTFAVADGIAGAAADVGVTVQVPYLPGLFTVFFSDQPVRDYDDAKAADAQAYAAFCRALLERGVYPPASQFEAWFPSLAHTPDQIERTIAVAREAFETL
jgi:glutamate-1-semialdehyde 2,1-aminomutase